MQCQCGIVTDKPCTATSRRCACCLTLCVGDHLPTSMCQLKVECCRGQRLNHLHADLSSSLTPQLLQVPKLPMRPTFSLWTDQSSYAFGGTLNPAAGPWEAGFNNMRQVVCDQPAPTTTPLGPSWLYA